MQTNHEQQLLSVRVEQPLGNSLSKMVIKAMITTDPPQGMCESSLIVSWFISLMILV